MSKKENLTKTIIRKYLLDEELLRKKATDDRFEFGFQFVYPPSTKSFPMSVVKPKGKDFIVISIGIQMSKQRINALNSLENGKKENFFRDLRKFFILKNVFFGIDAQNFRYEISEQIFLKKNGDISKNSFYNAIRTIFNCAAYSNIIFEQYCSGKITSEELPNLEGRDFSLYT
jgi:hypothetical protein